MSAQYKIFFVSDGVLRKSFRTAALLCQSHCLSLEVIRTSKV